MMVTSGPYLSLALSDVLERRWLHYAFITVNGRRR